MIIVDLIVQILSFGFFVVVSVIFHKKILDNPTSASLTVSIDWNRYLIGLYIDSGLIMVHCVLSGGICPGSHWRSTKP